MRWMWIDRIVSLEPGERLVAIKHVSMAEEHLHDHFPASPVTDRDATPVMPASLILEGMAQTAGILVGHTRSFREKVILAKISKAQLRCDATPGCTIRYDARLTNIDDAGAATSGVVEMRDADQSEFTPVGAIDLMFGHADQNMAGVEFPEHNFVFSESFRTLLETSGVPADF